MPAKQKVSSVTASKLDQESAYAVCRLIDHVGPALKEDWDWEWLAKRRKDYRALIEPRLLKAAWALLVKQDWLSLQSSESQKRISTIAPMVGLENLRTLVLQGNAIRDLQPLCGMKHLTDLNFYDNRVTDLGVLENLPGIEELHAGKNPIKSFRPLEALPRLRVLQITTEQVNAFKQCRRLPHLLTLDVSGDDDIPNFDGWPGMPSLKALTAWGARGLSGIDAFAGLESVKIFDGAFSDLSPLTRLRRSTHLTLCLAKRRMLDVQPLRELVALRRLSLGRAKVAQLEQLTRLPVLHEVRIDDNSDYGEKELDGLRAELTPWDNEFKTEKSRVQPSLEVEVVTEKVFDRYDSEMPFGVRPGEYNGGMFDSERAWLVEQISDALSVDFEDGTDFELPRTGGLRRSERVILYSVRAHESFRDIASCVQKILCELKNDWIIWCQSLLDEAPEEQDIPEGTNDFVVWIYPDKIVATKENATVVRKLMAWD